MPHKTLMARTPSVGLNDAQRHHRMNLPCSITWKMASPVYPLFFERVTASKHALPVTVTTGV